MPGWTANSRGELQLQWTSLDDFLMYVNLNIAQAAQQYGYRVVLEKLPPDEPHVARI